MFPSGTRTAIACLMAGFITYIFLSKSVRIAIPFSIAFAFFAFILVFTKIGDGNAQIRRMRSAFDSKDASANTRSINQETIKKYLKEAPWGIGIAQGYGSVPANNKYTLMSTIPADSEYVYIWIRTGIIGITTFLICSIIQAPQSVTSGYWSWYVLCICVNSVRWIRKPSSDAVPQLSCFLRRSNYCICSSLHRKRMD